METEKTKGSMIMDFEEAIELIRSVLKNTGSSIEKSQYDGLIVKRLEASNTLDANRTTKQSHIAITGPQMDMFPYVRADGYFEVEYKDEDPNLKKYFVAQIPAYLHKENLDYLDGENAILSEPQELVHVSIVRSRRNGAADQIQMSMTYMDSPKFIQFRRAIHTGSYLIMLKRDKELLYDIYAVDKADGAMLEPLNNAFCKLPTNTTVKLDEIMQSEDSDMGTDPLEEHTNQNSPIKTCLEVKLSPRIRTCHPLNFIIYGAPGTGKTYSTAEYALAIIENRKVDISKKDQTARKKVMDKYKELVKEGQIVFTTFHQSYGYEEFIQGLRPDTSSETMTFKNVDGVFKKIADEALNHSDKDYVIIIDEINRANISKVFGELITLIEDDKRWGEVNELSVTLQSGDPFAVPNNLYIVGTMNSADKSISLIDAALRRRFSFIEQRPDDSLVTDPLLRSVLKEMNLMLADKLESIDLLVGHSYFMNKSADDLCDIMNHSIIPLLYEYFYDQRKRVRNLLDDIIAKTSAPITVDDNAVGRLRVKEKAEVTEDDAEQV